jgi:hypothetical protein
VVGLGLQLSGLTVAPLERQLKGVELSCRLGFEQDIIITVVEPPVKTRPTTNASEVQENAILIAHGSAPNLVSGSSANTVVGK